MFDSKVFFSAFFDEKVVVGTSERDLQVSTIVIQLFQKRLSWSIVYILTERNCGAQVGQVIYYRTIGIDIAGSS